MRNPKMACGKQSLDDWSVALSAHRTGAVSYTHLDVYKRQHELFPLFHCAFLHICPLCVLFGIEMCIRDRDYKAHSMSVSDVIITNRGGDMQAYYVDRFGFAELPDFAAQREKILDIVPEIENVDYENDLTCISFYRCV